MDHTTTAFALRYSSAEYLALVRLFRDSGQDSAGIAAC